MFMMQLKMHFCVDDFQKTASNFYIMTDGYLPSLSTGKVYARSLKLI